MASERRSRSAESDELSFAGLRAQAEALAGGAASASSLVDEALDRITAAEAEVNAFRCVRGEAARAEAAAADERIAAGERAPLLGVPVAIKDDMDLAGEATQFGCAGDFELKRDDGEVARRLRAAGAIIVGKTTTSELGQWPMAEGEAFGTTRNPWDPERTPGGSSGGSAAAVAAGMVPAAVGSDGAGSVRIPAAWTHLVGIKPQRGRVSTWPDPEAFNGLTCIGPLARSVGDAALLLDVVAGNRAGDRHRPRPADEPYLAAADRADPGRLRIALSLKPPFTIAPSELDPELGGAVERLAGRLEGLGHEVVRADPAYGLVGASFMPRSTAGIHDWVGRVPDRSLLDRRTRGNARTGRLLSGPALALARAIERPLRLQVGRIFRRFDVVITPTTATPPPPVGWLDGLGDWETDKAIVAACPYAWVWNVLGWPAISVPAGLVAGGLPAGAQLVGPESSEAMLIGLAAQLEQAERWHERRPPSAAGTV